MHGGYHAALPSSRIFRVGLSRLAAAPWRPSTNRMYYHRWLRFAHWAAGQGFDPLSPTAAQKAAFLYSFLTPMTCRLKRSKATGYFWPQLLTALAKRQ